MFVIFISIIITNAIFIIIIKIIYTFICINFNGFFYADVPPGISKIIPSRLRLRSALGRKSNFTPLMWRALSFSGVTAPMH
jgi:hypothetical protein